MAASSLSMAIFCTIFIHGVIADGNITGLREEPSFSMDGADYLPYNRTTAYQIILPGFKFNCYGSITNWSALLVFNQTIDAGFEGISAAYEIHFQVWRPNGTGRYTLAGFHRNFALPSNSVPTGNDGLAYYNITNAVEAVHFGVKPLYFQPGDILGVYISHDKVLRKPFYLTYQRAGNDTDNDLVMDMLYTSTSAPGIQPLPLHCQASECFENITTLKSVIPNIYFNYEPLTGNEDVFQQQNVSNVYCEMPDPELKECHSSVSFSSTVSSSTQTSTPIIATSSLGSSPTAILTSPYPTPSPPSSPSPSVRPRVEGQMLLHIIAITTQCFLVILVVGALLFIMAVVLVKKKRKKAKEESLREVQPEVLDTQLSQINGKMVDEVGYDVPIQRQGGRNEVDPIYNEIKNMEGEQCQN